MIPSHFHRTLFIVASVGVWAACAAPQKPATSDVEMITLPAKILEQDFQSVTVEAPFSLNNPTAGPARVPKVMWEATVDGQDMARGELDFSDFLAPAGTETKSALRIPIALTEENTTLRPAGTKDVLSIKLHAELHVGSGTGAEIYEADWTTEFLAPQLPTIELIPQAARTDETIELNFILAVQNTNPFAVRLDGVEYTLFVQETEILSGTVARGQRLDSASRLEFDLHQVLGKEKHAELVQKIGREPALVYRMSTHMMVAGQRFELPIEGEAKFPR